MSDDNKLPEPDNIDDTFGLCPECGRYNDCLNVGRSHWFYCHTHKTKWLIGANLFSGWRDEDETIWGANNKRLEEYREVHPVFLEHPAGLAKLATASVNGGDTISANAADPWQALELLGSRLERSNDIEALDGLEAAVAAFAASELSLEQTAVARFLRALLGQLSRRKLTITRSDMEGWIDCPF